MFGDRNYKKSTEYSRIREDQAKHTSKERLKKVGQQKIKTTMIGALATIEERLGYLWVEDENMKALFESVRSEILDKGNNQIRNFEAELANYDVTWLKYKMTLPVKGKN